MPPLSRLQKAIREQHEDDTGLELHLCTETQALRDGLALVFSDGRVTAQEARWLAAQIARVDDLADASLENNRRINGMYARLVSKEATPTTTTIPFPVTEPQAA